MSVVRPASNADPLNTPIRDRSQDARVVTVWESCSICGAETKKNELSEGAYLFSFAKYLELLIYSPLLCKLFATVMRALKAPPPPPEHEAQTTPTWKQPALPSAIFIVIPSGAEPNQKKPRVDHGLGTHLK
ncbi:hypothetical protein C8J55DRAFT_566318 [Lentinula edodes]|uniref:Uncharacterized protein n=1 Tax=Lentinula lateritia TaxID=40482 RepID=A0A9W8ZS51_9AGAR|nr:hypothetical protein C8J55DRAFT_566318 [Lentinula edodes]